MICSLPAAHDIVLPCHETVSERHRADTTDATSSQEPWSFSPQSTAAPIETCIATPKPSTIDSETDDSSTPLPFNVSLLRRPRNARETPSARQVKQAVRYSPSFSESVKTILSRAENLCASRAESVPCEEGQLLIPISCHGQSINLLLIHVTYQILHTCRFFIYEFYRFCTTNWD